MIQSIKEHKKDLQANYPGLTEYEALTLAIALQRNEILESGLAVTRDNSKPSALEAVAMCLGHDASWPETNAYSALVNISEEIKGLRQTFCHD